MNQIVCDWCHNTIAERDEKKSRQLSLVDNRDGGMEMLGDLCPKCIADLRKWLKGGPALRRRRSPNQEGR